MTTHSNIQLLDKTSAYWYACGYNDNRTDTRAQPFVDPMEFCLHWASLCESATTSRPSLQDAFKRYVASHVLPMPEEGIDRCGCGCKYWFANKCEDCGTRFSGVAS